MAKKSRDNKSPPIAVEIGRRFVEAVCRVFDELTELFCNILQYLRLRIVLTTLLSRPVSYYKILYSSCFVCLRFFIALVSKV